MRRNRLPALLIAFLLLTACAPAGKPTPSPEPSPAPTLAPTPVPIFDVQQQWQTPDQAYDNTPWWQDTPCFYGEPLLELIPAPDYGLIYPYVGGVVYNQYYDGNIYSDYHGGTMYAPLYGLCTADSQIITAPIYGGSYFRFNDGEHIANLLYNTAGEKSASGDQPCTLYASDGSWVLEFESVLMHETTDIMTEGSYFVDVGYLAVKKNGFWGTVGYDGQTLEPFIHETPEGLYHADRKDENGHEWHWYGGDVFLETWWDDGWKSETILHIAQTALEDYHIALVRDVVYIYHWSENEEERRTLCYDHEGNFLSEESADLYWDLAEDISPWVASSTDEATGAITTYTEYYDDHDGAPIITVRPATFSID